MPRCRDKRAAARPLLCFVPYLALCLFDLFWYALPLKSSFLVVVTFTNYPHLSTTVTIGTLYWYRVLLCIIAKYCHSFSLMTLKSFYIPSYTTVKTNVHACLSVVFFRKPLFSIFLVLRVTFPGLKNYGCMIFHMSDGGACMRDYYACARTVHGTSD